MKTLKQVQTNRSFDGHAVCLLLVIFLLTLAANAQGVSAQSKTQTKTNQPSQSTLGDALQTSFGSAVEAVTAFKPFYLTADFNGDGAQDVLIVVRIKGHASELPKDVKVLNPFGYGTRPAFPADPTTKPTLALAIIHGSRGGWQNSPAAGKFLLVGKSPILILENDRATSGYPDALTNLMNVTIKRGKRPRDPWFPAAARFASILLGTEAADSILYWNGRTYRWKELGGGE